ncbi:MAG TPA: type II toxin-antitoxin system VapC family toxin [Candidatus Kapabacteria bacterium]
MLLLDTHVWVWSVHNDARLSRVHHKLLEETDASEIGVSAISCWEITKLVSQGRLTLHRPMAEWFAGSLGASGIRLLPLSPQISIEANHLPGEFHRDPADCIIVATSRIHAATLLTVDKKILSYAHVETI